MASFMVNLFHITYFTPFSSVSIKEFDHVNVGWVKTLLKVLTNVKTMQK